MGEGNSKEIPAPEYENGGFPSTESSPTNSKLIDASIKGNVEMVVKLLKKGKKVWFSHIYSLCYGLSLYPFNHTLLNVIYIPSNRLSCHCLHNS